MTPAKGRTSAPSTSLRPKGSSRARSSRYDWDTTTLDSEREALSNALTQAADDVALLTPGQNYTIDVTWKAASADQDAQPPATPDPTWGTPVTQSFQFRADPPAEVPSDLSPWILATTPGMDEVGVFRTEPVRIALATQKVAALFDAYGEELRVVIHAGIWPSPRAARRRRPWRRVHNPGLADDAVRRPDPGGIRRHVAMAAGRARDARRAWRALRADERFKHGDVYAHAAIRLRAADRLPHRHPRRAERRRGECHRPGASDRLHHLAVRRARPSSPSFIAPAPVNTGLYLCPEPRHRCRARPPAPSSTMRSRLQASPFRRYRTSRGCRSCGRRMPSAALRDRRRVKRAAVAARGSCRPLCRHLPTLPTRPTRTTPAVPPDWLSLVASGVPPAVDDLPRAGITRIVRGPGGTRAIALLANGRARLRGSTRPAARRGRAGRNAGDRRDRCAGLAARVPPGRWRTDGTHRRRLRFRAEAVRLNWASSPTSWRGTTIREPGEGRADRPDDPASASEDIRLTWACSRDLGVPYGPFTVWTRDPKDEDLETVEVSTRWTGDGLAFWWGGVEAARVRVACDVGTLSQPVACTCSAPPRPSTTRWRRPRSHRRRTLCCST